MVDNALNLSSAPYFPKRNRYDIIYKLEVYADVAEVHSYFPPKTQHVWVNREKISKFSDKSRKRMIDFIAKTVDAPDLFVTLTYSDDVVEYAHINLHRDLETMRKRWEYEYPDFKAIWRVEFVPRQSGKFYGQLKPHMHLLVWLPKYLNYEQVQGLLEDDGKMWRGWWHTVCGSQNSEHLRYYGCQVQRCMSRKHAYAYVAKYVAKGADENVTAGRRWGRIGKFEHPTEIETELTTRAYIELKRMMNKYVKRKSPKFYKQFRKMNIYMGCTVYGLGFLSQDKVVGMNTITRMIRMARDIALDYDSSG